MRCSLAIFIGLLLVGTAFGKAWAPETFPNPSTPEGAKRCGRGEILGFICDPEGFLSQASADVVEGHLKQIETAEYPYGSSHCHEKDPSYSPGFQVGVALLSSVVKHSYETDEEAVQRFANIVFDAWGVGNRECGNGVLLVLAIHDRQAFIAVGTEIDKFASRDNLASVIEAMKPDLRVKNYQHAVEQAVVDLGLVLAGANPHPHSHDSNDDDSWLDFWPWGLGAAICGLIGWGIWKEKNATRQAKTLLEKLQREQETAKLTGKYPAASCPICFEDLQPLNTVLPSAPPLEKKLSDNHSDKDLNQPLLTQRRSREKCSEDVQEPQEAGPSGHDRLVVEDKQSGLQPLCLPCGHTFCVPCISEWLERNQKCPICRTEVRAGDTSEERQRTLAARNSGTWAISAEDERYHDEMRFRMDRAHRMYPQYITRGMVDHAVAGGGNWIDFSSMRDQMMQSQHRSNFESSGHEGSSTSFGGGGHSHSGGVGGHW